MPGTGRTSEYNPNSNMDVFLSKFNNSDNL